jgi:hypothetical protein
MENSYLTNQKLTETEKFKGKSLFEVVNYAILLAKNMIKTGRDSRIKSDLQNRAMIILEEIKEGKDQLEEIKEIVISSSSSSSKGTRFDAHEIVEEMMEHPRGHDRRKNRMSSHENEG